MLINVTKCKAGDLFAIQHLMSMYDKKLDITAAHINKRDISLQARLATGELVGFVWCGLLANKTLCYMDKVVIHPDFHRKQILNELYTELFKIAYKMGVKQVFGIIRHDEYHDASGVQALRMGMGADKESYTYTFGNLDKMKSDLGLEI